MGLSKKLFGLLFLSTTMTGMAAAAFTSREGARVNPVTAQVFEVVSKTGANGHTYWCGAGDYAQRALKASWDSYVYIYRGLGPSETSNRRSAVQYTLDGSLAGATSAGQKQSINSLKRGESMRVRQAVNYCNQLPAGF